MCIAKTEKGKKCIHKCVRDSDMCNFHTDKYKKSVYYIKFWRNTIIRQLLRNTEYMKAVKFINDVENFRNLEEIRKRNDARLLEIGKRIAMRRIVNTMRRVISDPNYKMCRDRLMREFSEMNF